MKLLSVGKSDSASPRKSETVAPPAPVKSVPDAASTNSLTASAGSNDIRQIVSQIESELKAMGTDIPLPLHALEFVPDQQFSKVQWLYQVGYPGVDFPETRLPPGYEKIGTAGEKAADQLLRAKLSEHGIAVRGTYDQMSQPAARKRCLYWIVNV